MLYGDLNGEEIQKREVIYIRIVGSLFCTVETNIKL